jgi:beta-glucosidase
VEAFARYAEVVQDALGDQVRTFTTLNEPWCSAFLGYGSGEHAPGLTDPRAALRAAHHLLLAHGSAVAAMRRAGGEDHDLGIVLNLVPAVPATDDPADVGAAWRVDGIQNRLFLDAVLRGELPADVRVTFDRFGADDAILPGDAETIAEPIDLLGVNYYHRHHVAAGPANRGVATAFPGCDDVTFLPQPEPTTEMGWGVEPLGLSQILVRVHEEYGAPAMAVCENGAAFDDHPDSSGEVDDPDRTRFIGAHLAAAADAIEAGVDLRAFHVWSLLDNFEWAHGYGRRFGIVAVDYDSQERAIKTSGRWYRDLIAAHRGRRPVTSDRGEAARGRPRP